MPRDEIVQVRHVGEHVVAEQQVRCASRPRASGAVSRPKNSTSGRESLARRATLATLAAGSMPSTGMLRARGSTAAGSRR